ncbi:hypothetical protein IAD21_00879 [Abditibacteriota bacterium]|nr:hypothetical protein IAD21_00879 [Abditibacteriota bacterium]
MGIQREQSLSPTSAGVKALTHIMQNQISLNGAAQKAPSIPIKEPRVVFVTPEEAKRILEEYRYPGQRNLRPLSVARWARRSALDRWETHAIRICYIGARGYLTDGQHRLNGIVASGVGQWFVVIEKQCADEYEVARDYNGSPNGDGRTQADELRASAIEQELELVKGQRAAYTGAINMINTEFHHAPSTYLNWKDPVELQNGMREHVHEFALYWEAVRGGRTNWLKWSGVTAVGLITFSIDRHKADEFWRELASDQTNWGSVRGFQRDLDRIYGTKPLPSQQYIARMAAAVWNRFNKEPGVQVTKKSFQAVDEPIFIYGSTTYTGQQQTDPAQLKGVRVKQSH